MSPVHANATPIWKEMKLFFDCVIMKNTKEKRRYPHVWSTAAMTSWQSQVIFQKRYSITYGSENRSRIRNRDRFETEKYGSYPILFEKAHLLIKWKYLVLEFPVFEQLLSRRIHQFLKGMVEKARIEICLRPYYFV